MNLHEYQGNALLRKFNVKTALGTEAKTVDEALNIASHLGNGPWVVKAQIHAGGRGKGGGVKLAKTIDEVKLHATNILGMNLVTKQTGPQGKRVHTIFIQEGQKIEKEFYFSMLIDRASAKIAIISSSEGGMDIEEVAEKNPQKIITTHIDSVTELTPYHARQVINSFGLGPEFYKQGEELISNIYKAFRTCDASLIEINPLILNGNKELIALDVKFTIDDNALSRQKEISYMRDLTEENPNETEAINADLSYISLNGNIGCMVNGAGLAMATMDLIKLHGGSPANFLDVGGSATTEKVIKAFKIILSDSNVKAILVNIFGGIMKCDTIAEGIVAAAKELKITKPLVVRLNGTNFEKGKAILENSGLKIISANTLDEAAKIAVKETR